MDVCGLVVYLALLQTEPKLAGINGDQRKGVLTLGAVDDGVDDGVDVRMRLSWGIPFLPSAGSGMQCRRCRLQNLLGSGFLLLLAPGLLSPSLFEHEGSLTPKLATGALLLLHFFL